MNNSRPYTSSDDFCDKYATGYKMIIAAMTELLVSSIFSELIPAILCNFFTYQMYFGVDVTHPVYSVVFCNIVLSIIISCLKFVLKLVGTYVTSCIPIIINMFMISCHIFMNSICWIVVSLLRYHLLVTVKKQNVEVDVDMIKLKRIALVSYCGLVFIFGLIRSFLVLAIHPGPGPSLVNLCYFIILFFAFPITTCTIYYRIDHELKIRKRIADNEQNLKRDYIAIASEKTSSMINERHPTGTTVQDNKYFTRQKSKTNLRIKRSSSLKTNIDSSKTLPGNPIQGSSEIHSSPIFEIHDSPPYGGIYIGITEKNQNVNDQELDGVKKYAQRSISATPKDDLQSKNALRPFGPGGTYVPSLPNQVPSNEEKNESNPLQRPGGCRKAEDKFTFENTVNKKENSSYKYLNLHNDSPPKVGTTTMNRPKNDISRSTCAMENSLAQQGENVRNDIIEGNSNNHHQGAQPSNDADEEYKRSKEHKSMIKAILFNFIMNGILFFIFILSNIISEDNVTADLIVFINTILSLYSSLTSILSAIFCFEVVYVFFLQFVETTYDSICTFNNRISNILSVP